MSHFFIVLRFLQRLSTKTDIVELEASFLSFYLRHNGPRFFVAIFTNLRCDVLFVSVATVQETVARNFPDRYAMVMRSCY